MGTVCPMPPVTPDRISLPDRYRVVRHLANGGMASVWEAHDELLRRDVAVKVLASHLGEDERARRRFQREARAAAGLSSHPNVVTIYDVGEYKNRVFMVMEIMRGGTLADRMRSGREITHETAVRWLREAAAALDAAHEAGVVHRDVKPGNLMVTPGGEPVVLDFGLARLEREESALTLPGELFGTPAYMSPEQLEGDPARLDRRTDVYSLGAVLFEALTLRKPFEAPNRHALFRRILEAPAPDPREANPRVPSELATEAPHPGQNRASSGRGRPQTAHVMTSSIGAGHDTSGASASAVRPVARQTARDRAACGTSA